MMGAYYDVLDSKLGPSIMAGLLVTSLFAADSYSWRTGKTLITPPSSPAPPDYAHAVKYGLSMSAVSYITLILAQTVTGRY